MDRRRACTDRGDSRSAPHGASGVLDLCVPRAVPSRFLSSGGPGALTSGSVSSRWATAVPASLVFPVRFPVSEWLGAFGVVRPSRALLVPLHPKCNTRACKRKHTRVLLQGRSPDQGIRPSDARAFPQVRGCQGNEPDDFSGCPVMRRDVRHIRRTWRGPAPHGMGAGPLWTPRGYGPARRSSVERISSTRRRATSSGSGGAAFTAAAILASTRATARSLRGWQAAGGPARLS